MRILAATFAFNEGQKIQRTLARHPANRSYDLMVYDDGSTDGALDHVDPAIIVVRSETKRTVGKVFHACGVAIPPALRPADAPATADGSAVTVSRH